jgi:hypothetical protein
VFWGKKWIKWGNIYSNIATIFSKNNTLSVIKTRFLSVPNVSRHNALTGYPLRIFIEIK